MHGSTPTARWKTHRRKCCWNDSFLIWITANCYSDMLMIDSVCEGCGPEEHHVWEVAPYGQRVPETSQSHDPPSRCAAQSDPRQGEKAHDSLYWLFILAAVQNENVWKCWMNFHIMTSIVPNITTLKHRVHINSDPNPDSEVNVSTPCYEMHTPVSDTTV